MHGHGNKYFTYVKDKLRESKYHKKSSGIYSITDNMPIPTDEF